MTHFQAFHTSYRSPSRTLDQESFNLTVLWSRTLVEAMNKKGGPFGDNIRHLRADGTL